jgi:ABC-type antimicrobial peptide transport system permease subunit
VALALAASRLLSGLLYGVSAYDPVTFVGSTALVLAVTAAACYLPARRAAATDPVEALRAL